MKTTISNILGFIREGKYHPQIREAAVGVLRSQGISSMDYPKVFNAMLEYVRENVAFVRDPTKTDVCFSPVHTLNLGYQDCEDHAIVLASLLESIGIPTKLVIVSKNGQMWDHAFIRAGYPPEYPNRWVSLDSTIKGLAGTQIRYAKEKEFRVS